MALPQKVTNVNTVNPLDGLHMVVSWTPVTATPPVDGYNVYRSPTESFGDSEKVNSTLVTIAQFQDAFVQKIRRDVWYFIKAHNAEGEGPESDAASASRFANYGKHLEAHMYRVATEFIRRRGIILGFDGEEVDFFIKKVAGERCSCFDPIRNSGEPRCNLCYGTFWEGGFVKVTTRMRIIAHSELRSRQEMGLVIDTNPKAWVLVYPLLHSQDIVRRSNNQRFRVTDVFPGILGGFLTRQTCTLKEIEPTDQVYRVP